MDIDVVFAVGRKEPWLECNVCLLHKRCGRDWGLFDQPTPDISPCFRDTLSAWQVEGTPEYAEMCKEQKRIQEGNEKWWQEFLEKQELQKKEV